jgi:hypothetical protein
MQQIRTLQKREGSQQIYVVEDFLEKSNADRARTGLVQRPAIDDDRVSAHGSSSSLKRVYALT